MTAAAVMLSPAAPQQYLRLHDASPHHLSGPLLCGGVGRRIPVQPAGPAASLDDRAADRHGADRPRGEADRHSHAHEAHRAGDRSEEHTSELQSLMRISYAVFCLKKKKK